MMDRLAGVAGDRNDAGGQANVRRRQRRASPVAQKRKEDSPERAPRTRAQAGGRAEAADVPRPEDHAPSDGPQAGKRVRRTARKATQAAQEAAAAATGNSAAEEEQPNIAKRPRRRPRKALQPADSQDATAAPAAAQPAPVPAAAAQPVQASAARIAHPAEFEDNDVVFVNAIPAPVLPPPPRRPQLALLPGMGPPFPPRPPLRARRRARAVLPLQPPHPAPALSPRVAHTDLGLDSDNEMEHGSAMSTAGPVSGRRTPPLALPLGQASSPASMQNWPTGPPAGAAAVPVEVGAPQDPSRTAEARPVLEELRPFGPSLPLAPRIPGALTEARTAAMRARDSAEDDNFPHNSGVVEDAPAEAAQGEQAAAAQPGNLDAAKEGPAVHTRVAQTPAGSSATAAPYPEEEEEEEEDLPGYCLNPACTALCDCAAPVKSGNIPVQARI